jgi:hypothetical protein
MLHTMAGSSGGGNRGTRTTIQYSWRRRVRPAEPRSLPVIARPGAAGRRDGRYMASAQDRDRVLDGSVWRLGI